MMSIFFFRARVKDYYEKLKNVDSFLISDWQWCMFLRVVLRICICLQCIKQGRAG